MVNMPGYDNGTMTRGRQVAVRLVIVLITQFTNG